MCNLLLRDSVCDLFIQPGRRADDGDFGIGIEAAEDAARRNLSIDSFVSSAALLPIAKHPESPCSHPDVRVLKCKQAYLATAHHQDILILDAPCENQAPSRLHLRK